MPSAPARPSRGFLLSVAILLALLHAILAVTATADKCVTADEIAHVTAGHAYNTRNDYRLQPENGNLPQRLAGLPLTAAGAPLPSRELDGWKIADVWEFSRLFFYGQGLSTGEMLFLGRAMIALVSAATGLLVFLWSRMLFGWRGAFLSLLLFVFSPTFLAHGALATSDVVMAFFFLAAAGAWWRHLETPGWKWAAVSAVTTGTAFVAKFSAVLLPPMLGLAALAWAAREARHGGWAPVWRRLARSTAVHVAVAWAVIWAFYGFRFSAFAPDDTVGASFNHGWGAMLTGLGTPAKVIYWLKEWRVLPEAWLYGLAFVLHFAQARGAFLNGEYSVTGWVSFFPFAFLIKSTLPLLLLLLSAFAAAVRARLRTGAFADRAWPLVPLAALALVYTVTSLTSNLNIGHRHILPLYPVFFIVLGSLGRWLDVRRPVAALFVGGMLAWHVAEAVVIRPHYLAYFNQLVGGPRNGWRHLVDSSLDWGQDLPGLKAWLDEHARGEKIFLAYFGTGDPTYEGISAGALPSLPRLGPPKRWCRLEGGVYAVSATMLQHVYSPIQGAWTLALEKEFQELRILEPTLLAFQDDPSRRAALLREVDAAQWSTVWRRYELLRFARLCHVLRARRPDASIGYSILVHRLTDAEVQAATGGSLRDWTALIEHFVNPKP